MNINRTATFTSTRTARRTGIIAGAGACALALMPVLSLPAHAIDPADEMSLMLTRDTFIAAHTPSQSGLAGSDQDQALVAQAGNGNFADVEQASSRQGNIALSQQGDVNTAGLYQADGAGNVVQADQVGQSNYLTSTQSGSGNTALLTQNSNENRLALDQRNGSNNADVTQNGYSSLILEQDGGSYANIVLGPGDPLSPTVLTIIQPAGDSVTINTL